MNQVELYRFAEENEVWTYTSADSDQTYNSEVYTAVTLGRNEIESKNEISKANIEVSFSIDNEFARRLMRRVMETRTTLTIFRKNAQGGVVTLWKGRLVSVKPDASSIKLVFDSIFSVMARPGLRLRYTKMCSHALYDYKCGVNKDLFAVNATVTIVSNETVIVPIAANQPDGYYAGGMLEGPDGAKRLILFHAGNQLTLSREMASLINLPVSCRIFPGCPRDTGTCNNRFNNINNYGGFPHIPDRNPFDGSSIA